MIEYSEIENFFATVASFEQVVISGEKEKNQALLSQKKLIDVLNSELDKLSSNQEKLDSLTDNIDQVIKGIQYTIKNIDSETRDFEKRLQIQDKYKERLIILVFGKVNSGKSSFSNYFVDLFQKRHPAESIEYFYFENGEQKILPESSFKVGSTETTAKIQGVELGKLVLLDTPGLHSVTKENGELTKKYTDSADLILWLSGSNSPGQTQELEELKDELEKGKVLFPVITKSDITEEDIEIVNGEEKLVSKLVMKSSDTQKLQQDDVYKRAQNKLLEFNFNADLNKLHKSISLSTHYVKEYKEQKNVLVKAGISNLFSGLNDIYDLVIESKKNNVRMQVKNYLSDINTHLAENIEKPFSSLQDTLKKQKKEIKDKSGYINTMVLNSVMIQVSGIISKHSQQKDVKPIVYDINQAIINEINQQLDIAFEAIFKSLIKSITVQKNVEFNLESGFEDETISFKYQKGATKKSLTSAAGGAGGVWAGAALGNFLVPVVGGVVGGLLGGFIGGILGDKAGDYFIETETITKAIGIDSSKVEAELNSKLQKVIPKLVNDSIDALLIQFEPLEKVIEESLKEIEKFKAEWSYI